MENIFKCFERLVLSASIVTDGSSGTDLGSSKNLDSSDAGTPSTEAELPSIIERKQELVVLIDIGTYAHRQKMCGRDGRKLTANCWTVLHEIYEPGADGDVHVIDNYFHCIVCKEIEYSVRSDGNTNKLKRHKCVQDLQTGICSADKEKLKFAETRFVYMDNKSYNSVEGTGYKQLLKTVFEIGQNNPKVKVDAFERDLSVRNTIKNTIGTVLNETIKLIAHEISLAKKHNSMSIIIDNWTDNFQRNSYFGIILLLAYTDESGRILRKKYTLNVDEVTEPVKSKQVLAEHLYRVLAKYGLTPDEIRKIIFIADRGGNIKYMLKDENILQVYCFAHILNNIVEHMLQDSQIQDLVNCASSLTSYMKCGNLCKELLTSLKTFSRSRWNGVYIMFKAILTNFQKIIEVLGAKSTLPRNPTQKNPMDYITNVNIDLMSKITPVLKPFYEITQSIEGYKDPSIHLVWPYFIKITESVLKADDGNFYLEDNEYGAVVENVKTLGRDYISKRFPEIKPQMIHKIATVLHPLCKNLPKIDAYERIAVYRDIEIRIKKMIPLESTPAPKKVRRNAFEEPFLNDFFNYRKLLFF